MNEITSRAPAHDKRGVSPVIGVILMVAITVILAAVIASFVLSFGGTVTETVQAGADITVTDDGNATVTWISEGNAERLNVTADAATVTNSGTIESVGGSVTVIGNESTTITVTAIGGGGSRTVVAQREVTLTDGA